jgi:branched-chain amino acid transport system substrate-binding protein
MGIISVEAVRAAQKKFGTGKPMTGEQVRWGIENLEITAARIKELGVEGLMSPIKVSCYDHEGGGAVKFQEWDGKKWNVITDWIETDQSIVRPMIEASAAKYAEEKGIKMREGADSQGSDCTAK